MILKEISGQRQLEFMKNFDYIREAGTEGEIKAAASLQEYLKSFGVDSHLEEFEFHTWKVYEASFTVTEPFEKTYKIAGYGRCGATPEGGIEAPFLFAEKGDDINLSYANGKIVMTCDPMNPDMYQKLVNAGAVAFLTIAGTPVDKGDDLNPDNRAMPIMPEHPICGGIIHYQDAVELVERGASRARFTLKAAEIKDISRNVIARIEGTDLADEVLTLTAHFDSVPEGKGAYDNMAAVAIILEICRYFKEHQPRRTIEFICFGAEERGLVGSRNYVSVHKDELKNHKFNMNVDLAGQLVGGNKICVTGDHSIAPMLGEMAREIGIGTVTVTAVWASDSNSFAWSGVPAMTLNRDGFGMHTRHDIVDYISPWALERSAKLLGYIAEQLANMDTIPFPQEIPEQFMEELGRFYNRFKK